MPIPPKLSVSVTRPRLSYRVGVAHTEASGRLLGELVSSKMREDAVHQGRWGYGGPCSFHLEVVCICHKNLAECRIRADVWPGSAVWRKVVLSQHSSKCTDTNTNSNTNTNTSTNQLGGRNMAQVGCMEESCTAQTPALPAMPSIPFHCNALVCALKCNSLH